MRSDTPIFDRLGLADELAAFEDDWQQQRRRYVQSMPRARYAAALAAKGRRVPTVNGDRGPIGGRVTVTENAAGEPVEMTREEILEAMHEVVATLAPSRWQPHECDDWHDGLCSRCGR